MEELASAAKRPEEEGGRREDRRGKGREPTPAESPRRGVGAELNPPCEGPERWVVKGEGDERNRHEADEQTGRRTAGGAGGRANGKPGGGRPNQRQKHTNTLTHRQYPRSRAKKKKLNPKRQHRITRPFFTRAAG